MPMDIIDVGKYRFNIEDNTSTTSDGVIYNRNFKIGGNYKDCVNVSITYDNYNKPISAKIPTLVYDEECSKSAPLDRGEGTIIMIKTLLRYINNKIPEIEEFVFEDKSNIECGTEEEKHQKRHRKRGTHARPVVLYYFSIAFNSITWYEKHFNAYQQDLTVHKAYRKRVNELLYDEKVKPTFNDFLRIAQPPMKYIDELKVFYENSETYGVFFNSIPKADRCRLMREWIPTFMEYYLKGVFKNTDWVINIKKMGNTMRQSGGRSKNRTLKRNSQYYCPIGHVKLSFDKTDIGV
jgi:hypothetical protein